MLLLLLAWGPFASASNITSVSANGSPAHTCALRQDGSVVCWGDNSHGELDVPAGSFVQVSTGVQHTCAVRSTSGSLACWGRNHNKQSEPPEGSFTFVSAGNGYSCALRQDRTIACWGEFNAFARHVPLTPPSGTFRALSASKSMSVCAIRDDGRLVCWGTNYGSPQDDGPQEGPAEFKLTSLSLGKNHNCGVSETGTVICWGNGFCQEGTCTSNSLGALTGPAGTYTTVTAGDSYTCALREAGTVECWGHNLFDRAHEPPGRFVSIDAGLVHTCALRETGVVVCWGKLGFDGRMAPPDDVECWPEGVACWEAPLTTPDPGTADGTAVESDIDSRMKDSVAALVGAGLLAVLA